MATEQLGPVVRRVGRAVRVLGAAGLTDGQLLEHFIARRDEAAFEALVARHGPMVFGACLRLLRDRDEAEDAFQATFLVLVRKAASVLPREMVAHWLYGVACQTAVRLRSAAAKRRRRERPMPDVPEPASEPRDAWEDLGPVLDRELSRLPERYRAPVVLCDLEGKTRKEAARHVGCPEGTLSSRLSRARALLARRLARHGLGLSGAALGLMLARKAAAGPPAALVISTVKAAAWLAAGQAAAAGGVISARAAALTEGVLKAMLLAKLRTVLKASLGSAAVLLLVLAAVVGPGPAPSEAAGPGPATPAAGAAPAPPAPRGRVAVFNLTAVVKGHAKFKAFQEEAKADLKAYEDRIKKKQAELDDLRRRIQNAPQDKETLDAQARAAQREVEDLNSEARRVIGEKTDKQSVELYKEIQAAARRYAKDHDLELVLHYTDSADGDDALSAANVARKMQAAACVPIYAADGVDITADIINVLNGK
jgi:RNA polymerase sigma factor (sigma-70 family)